MNIQQVMINKTSTFRLSTRCYGLILIAALVLSNGAFALGNTQDEGYVRLLNQATFGATPNEFNRIKSLTASGWLDDQFAKSYSKPNWNIINELIASLDARTLNLGVKFGSRIGVRGQLMVNDLWERYITADDQLRQRVTAALLEIFVINSNITMKSDTRRLAANFVDLLEKNAFGNFRTLLEDVSKSPAMGYYLSHINNKKATYDSAGNEISIPDENYAREIMQLFTIGLYELNKNGTLKLVNGKPIETYTQDDVFNLARVFTGWKMDKSFPEPEFYNHPMVAFDSIHSPEQKRFLGTVIPAGTNTTNSLKIALDALFNHPNVGPFIGKQLIQRLVTSNPNPAYVARVSGVFNNNGSGVRGDMKAVIKAILLDPEANPNTTAQNPNRWGKMREPMMRLTAVARLLGIQYSKPNTVYPIGDLTQLGNGLGQTPMRSPSVFNFFRPGYVPPDFAAIKLVAPEFQIITSASLPGSLNFVNNFIDTAEQVFNIRNKTVLETQAQNTAQLVGFLDFYMTANTMTQENIGEVDAQVNSISPASPWIRAKAALQMVSGSPFFLTEQ